MGLLSDRRREMGSKDDCPYQRVEYLESVDNSWIDTGYIPNIPDLEIQMGFMPIQVDFYSVWFSSYSGNGSLYYGIVQKDYNADKILINYGTEDHDNDTISGIEMNTKYNIVLKDNQITINDKVYPLKFNHLQYPFTTNQIRIFNRPDNPIRQIIGRLYYFSIKSEGNKVFDLIPVRIGDEGYMYDKVSGKLFGNSGTGKFILGPDILYDTNGYDYVDMGEAGIWATCNIGASKPEEAGLYFAWGETEPKETYSWDNYKFGTENNITKYNDEDGLTELQLEDDAAHANMGGDWRIGDLYLLSRYCDFIFVEDYNGVKGVLFTSKSDSTKTIFVPYAGWYDGTTYLYKDNIHYWPNLRNKVKNVKTPVMPNLTSQFVINYNDSNRNVGRHIRAFIPKK